MTKFGEGATYWETAKISLQKLGFCQRFVWKQNSTQCEQEVKFLNFPGNVLEWIEYRFWGAPLSFFFLNPP